VTVETTGASANLLVDTRGGADTVNLRTTGGSSFTRVLTGAADDRLVLSSVAGTGGDGLGVGGTVDGILGTVEIDAGAGTTNSLAVDDSQATKANAAAVLTDRALTGVAAGTIRYTATGGGFTKTPTVDGTPAANDGILVRNTGFADTFAVRSTRTGSTTRIEGLGGSDTFTVSSDESKASDAAATIPSVDGILGVLTIAGGDHDAAAKTTLSSQDRSNALATGDVLLVADQGDDTADTKYTLTPTTVDRTGMARITYVSTETIRLRTSRMGATTEVTDTVAGGNTFVVGNAGIDRVDVLSTGSNSNLEVSGAGAADLVHLRTTGAASFTRILGEAGDDRVVLSSMAGTGSLAAPFFSPDGNVGLVRGVVSVDGGAGAANRLVVDDSTAADNSDVVVTNNRITGLAAGEIHYAASGGSFTNAGRNDGILLRGSAAGRDVFLVTSTLLGSTIRIDTQGGDDLVSVGSTTGVDRGDLDQMQGLLTLDTGSGTDLVHANDRGAGYDALRSGGQPKPLNNAATQTGAITFENTAKFNYRLDATTLRNDIFNPKRQDDRLGLIGGLSRTFAGIDYVGASLERFELVGTDNVNVFTVLPSAATTFFVDGKLPVSGVALFGGGDYLNLDTTGTIGRKLGIESVGQGTWTFTSAHKPVQFTSIERFNHVDIVAVSRENTTPWIDVYDAETFEYKFGIMPYESTFRGGARLATGDVNNDGISDLVVVPGSGRPAEVRIYDGTPDRTGAYAAPRLNTFSAFAPGFAAGAFVSLGDVNRDGANDIVLGADGGSGARIYR
ncbi:MAG: FG-GAP-like repeat-containing protein, partial [Planctomycetota bacterium]